jgi:dihydroorotase
VLQRALLYASDLRLHGVAAAAGAISWESGVAASGPLATRLGLSGVPVAAETIAICTRSSS